MRAVYEESEYVLCDLRDICRYLRQYNQSTAKAFLETAYDTFEFLAENPAIGRPRPEFGYRGLRSWRMPGFGRYLIFYRELPGKIQIWRVLHGARDLQTILGRS
jgi:toxin ParE1/3/4